VQPDDGRTRLCSNFALVRGVSPRVGDHVLVARELVRSNSGAPYEVFLIYPSRSPDNGR
jgi:hypothetical protein